MSLMGECMTLEPKIMSDMELMAVIEEVGRLLCPLYTPPDPAACDPTRRPHRTHLHVFGYAAAAAQVKDEVDGKPLADYCKAKAEAAYPKWFAEEDRR